jgi:hypothetical protein
MATTTTNFGWDIPQSTDLVKDGATAIAALGQDIDTAFIDLKGGTTGQVLAKASGTDLDFSWVAQDDSNAIQNTQLTGKGALISAFSAGTPATLTVGTNGHVLTADSTQATGIKWAAAPAGKVAQVLQTIKSDTFTSTSTSFTDITGLSVSITPSSASSKILVLMSVSGATSATTSNSIGFVRLMRDTTPIAIADSASNRQRATGSISTRETNAATINFTASADCLDSPGVTSAVTYKVQGIVGGGTFYININ